MSFHSRVSFGPGLQMRTAAIRFLCLVLLSGAVFAGTHTISDFPLTNDGLKDSALVDLGGLALGIDHWDIVKLYGDASPTGTEGSNYSDVVTFGRDTFALFWVDTSNLGVYKRNLVLTPSTATFTNGSEKLADYSPYIFSYLHADGGKDNYLVSYVENGSSQLNLVLHNGTSSAILDSSSSSRYLFSSQCQLDADTFLVVYSTDLNKIKLRKVYSDGATFDFTDEVVLASESGLFNCSVASDSNGTILVTWMKGFPNGAKSFHYQILDRDLTSGPSGSMADVRDDDLTFYDDAPVVSYAPGWFAVSTFDGTGVYLHKINSSGQRTTEKPINAAGINSSALAVNENNLMLLCRGDVDGNGVSGIEGYKYQIDSDNLVSPEYFCVSSQSADVQADDLYSTFLNCALDDSGSVAAVWRHHDQVNAAAWANRSVRSRKGFWISPVDSVQVDPGDSLQFFRSVPEYTSLDSWFIEDSIRTGSSLSDFGSDGGWVSLKDSLALASIRSTENLFQYKIVIGRKTDPGMDSLISVIIPEVDLPYNIQPVITDLDSLKINSRNIAGAQFFQERTILSRSDTLQIQFTVRDRDRNDRIDARVTRGETNDTAFTVAAGPLFNVSVDIPPFAKTDSTYSVKIDASDRSGWNAAYRSLSFQTRNSHPEIDVKSCSRSSPEDTLFLNSGEEVVFQEDDSLEVFWSIADTNDNGSVVGKVHLDSGNGLLGLDSCVSEQRRSFVFAGSLLENVLWSDLIFTGIDQDTSLSVNVKLRANHIPRIRSSSFGGQSFQNGDSVRVKIGVESELLVNVRDIDVQIGDTLLFTLRTASKESSVETTDSVFSLPFTPDISDSSLFVKVSDQYGRSDSILFYYKFPRYQPDTSLVSDYAKAFDSIGTGPSLIRNSKDTSSVFLPLENSGNDSMSIVSVDFTTQSHPWLSLRVAQGSDTAVFDSENSGQFNPVLLSPESELDMEFIYTAEGLEGDGFAYDTVIIETTDPAFPFDSIPVRMEHNDLPQILNVGVDFDAGTPYEPLLRKRMAGAQYTFPPHAKLVIHFSEPMDSVSAHEGLQVYSVFDSLASGSSQPIGLEYEWSSDYSALAVSADYQNASSKYGFQPPAGLFIPTDSLTLVLTSKLTDRASTPSGPNELDILKKNQRTVSVEDTAFNYSVDSITFSLIDVGPDPGEQVQVTKPSIMLAFSSEVYARSVDTSRVNNQTLEVTSLMGGDEQVSFDSVRVEGETIRFYPSRRFYYGDLVKCRYRGISVRNSMGFFADNSGDGIPMPLMDPESTDDDVEWSFEIEDNELLTVSPREETTLPDVGMTVELTFREPLLPGIFDTDTSSDNRSFKVFSRFGGTSSSPFSSIEFSDDSTRVTLNPAWNFFSSDTITCQFTGFVNTYSYTSEDNYPSDSASGGYSWNVYTSRTGFYTYPNPYRPAKDRRHCRDGGPCGVVFKNLHVISGGAEEVKVHIFNLKSVPVFSSPYIPLVPGAEEYKPQWIWDTRNRAGRKVSSGVYFYVICDSRNKVLLKGKLMIVR
ncbi:MAG: hypothetical protein ACLFQB_07430 [Chitinispirillaceae bacterium]